MTLNFLFWNMGQKERISVLANLIKDHSVNVLILAECPYDAGHLASALTKACGRTFELTDSPGCYRVEVLTSFSAAFVSAQSEANTYSIRRVEIPNRQAFLLAVAHLPSALHSDWGSQQIELFELANDIRLAENEVGHLSTVLVGDLNANPFEPEVASAPGLHSVMTRKVAMTRTRTVQGRDFPFFYNPMWSFFGEMSDGPLGTYFYRNAQNLIYFWNIFDQVLVRPDLLPYFDDANLKVLTSDGTSSLLSSLGRPDKTVGSDHLPIVFQLSV